LAKGRIIDYQKNLTSCELYHGSSQFQTQHFTERESCGVLTERQDLLVRRQNYLYDICKYREEGRTVFYLDETYIDVGDCVEKLWVDKTTRSKHDAFNRVFTYYLTGNNDQLLIVLHIGSQKGFLDGDLYVLCQKQIVQTSMMKLMAAIFTNGRSQLFLVLIRIQ